MGQTPLKEGDAAGWQMRVDGRPLPHAVRINLLELEIYRGLEHASRFCLRLSDPDCALADGSSFTPGAAVDISLSYGGGAGTSSGRRSGIRFDGELTAWGLERTSSGTVLLVRGLDRSHRLLRSRRIRFVDAQDEPSLLGALLRPHGLQAQGSGRGASSGTLQLGVSDLELIRALGARQRLAPAMDGKSLRLAPPVTSGPARTLEPDERIQRFDLTADWSTLPTRVEVVGWDMAQHRRLTAQAGSTDLRWTGGTLQHGLQQARKAFGDALHIQAELHPVDAREAKVLAQRWLQHRIERTLAGMVWVSGFPMVEPGQLLKVEDAGFPLPGPYLVTAVQLLLSASGGATQLELARPFVQAMVRQ